MRTLSLELEDKSVEYLEKFGAKIGEDWPGVVMIAIAMMEAIQEGVLENQETIVLTGKAYGPLDGVMISPWRSEPFDEAKPLAEVITFPGKLKDRAP